MASRAFFRCRACGEPVVAGAYRCPVCGIDFPAGTPGAPKAPDPPQADFADVGPSEDAPPSADSFDANLNFAPGAASGGASPAGDNGAAAAGAASPNGPGRREPKMSAAPSDPVAEDAEFEEEVEVPRPAGSSLSVRPARPQAAAVAVPPEAGKAVAKTRRRSRSRALGGTLVSAFVLIGAVLVGAYFFGDRIAAPILNRVPTDALSVIASDGWVSLPSDDSELLVTADGPFRLRVDGEVYTLTGAQAVRIPPQSQASLRIIRAPNSAKVQEVTTR